MIAATIVYLTLCLLLQVHCEDPCEVHATCKKCVQYSSCQWCSSNDFKGIRCMTATNNITGCSDIQNPKGSVDYSEHDRDFDQLTQIRPQRFNIKLRPSETQTFNFSFKAAKDYPADLYFLIDSSWTMTSVLSTTARSGESIYNKMRQNTDNVLLGLGTFIDKSTAPFIQNKKEQIYSFRHDLKMTGDIKLFKDLIGNKMNNTKNNMDGPEGGFDALAQAIACQKEIGWRNESTKIIFFLTDNLSHIAGDGKPAGIIYPYDGECHTINGVYTKEFEMDYPSISMISELAAKKGVTIVFMIEKNTYYKHYQHYKIITKNIQRSKCLQYTAINNVIKFKNSDLDNIISSIYEEITQTIKLEVSMSPEDYGNILIEFTPECNMNNKPDCTVQQNTPRTIQGRITLLKYYGKDNINLDIIVGSTQERLALNVQVADCECEAAVPNSSNCTNQGTKKCGVCECNENKTGKFCECTADANNKEDDSDCKPPDGKDELPCRGAGFCKCGTCHCNKGREGHFCECLKDSCVKNCNGVCYCGKCICNTGWTGEACQCHEGPCKKVNDKECNGRGECHCGKCKCNAPAKWDARDSQDYETCEMKPCTNCHNDQCSKLRDCAICCQNYDENHCSSLCGNIRVTVIETLSNNITTENGLVCSVNAEIGCYSRFQYYYNDIDYTIHLLVGQNDMDCLENYYLWGGGVLAALVIIGVLTLVGWKLLTDLRDRREYQRFLKTHGMDAQGHCANPLYEPATTTIRNPAFRKPSLDYTLR